jgi:hypothetical protein
MKVEARQLHDLALPDTVRRFLSPTGNLGRCVMHVNT